MTKSTITREQLIKKAQEQIEFCRHTKITGEGRAHVDQCAALFEIALAALDSEPVAYMYRDNLHSDARFSLESKIGNWSPEDINEYEISETPLYRHAQPTVDSEPVGYFRRYDPDFDALITQCDKGAQDSFPLYLHAQSAKGFESAGWQFKSVNGDWLGLIGEHGKNQAVREGCEVREVFAMDDGVNERDHVRREHAEWSQATFGNVGPVGPLKHLSKEALEAAAEPGDLSEWADMQFLLWDAQRRAGITDEQITQAMIEKLVVNKQREWPEPKDGEPRLHIKAQPAQVTEREPIAWLNDAYLARGVVDGEAGSEDAGPGYIPVYREAQPAPVVPEEKPIPNTLSMYAVDAVAAIAEVKGWNACRAAMLQPLHTIKAASAQGSLPKTGEVLHANSPVIPDGSEHCPCCGKKLRRACSVEGCGGKHVAHGLCQKHYDMKRWEDPEQVRKFREAGKRYRRKTKSAAAAPQEVSHD